MSKLVEPCVVCSEDTAAGSPLFSDRRVATPAGAERTFLCSLCADRALGRRQPPMTDEDRAKLERGAFAFGSFAPGAH